MNDPNKKLDANLSSVSVDLLLLSIYIQNTILIPVKFYIATQFESRIIA